MSDEKPEDVKVRRETLDVCARAIRKEADARAAKGQKEAAAWIHGAARVVEGLRGKGAQYAPCGEERPVDDPPEMFLSAFNAGRNGKAPYDVRAAWATYLKYGGQRTAEAVPPNTSSEHKGQCSESPEACARCGRTDRQCWWCSKRAWGPDPRSDGATNESAHYRGLWEEHCKAVAELCDLAGAKPDDMHDVWTLKLLIEDLKQCRERASPKLLGAVAEVVDAAKAFGLDHSTTRHEYPCEGSRLDRLYMALIRLMTVDLRLAKASLSSSEGPPEVVDGECMQDCDSMGVECPKRGVPSGSTPREGS